jgi:purine-binding chemotaxis protein CheW
MTETARPQAAQTVLLATFFVRDALFALDAAGIQEVIRLGPLTPVRHASREVAGILNLRGKIVTVLDLGLKLGFPPAERDGKSRIFIIEDRNEFIGLLVDRVDEVVEVEPGDFQPSPANTPAGQERFFRGVCRASDRIVTVLDAAPLLSVSTP